jgi:hypothetical protein
VGQVTAQGNDSGLKKLLLQLPILKLTQLRQMHLLCLNIELPKGVLTCSRARGQRGSVFTGASSIATSRVCDAAAAAPAVLPQLQELKLHACQLTMESLCQLLSTTALTKLHWQSVTIYSDSQP